MLKNYIKIAFRNLSKTPCYTSINLVGLSVGFSVCLLIAIFVRFHLGFEKNFINSDRIYRVTRTTVPNGNETVSGRLQGPMAQTLVDELSSVKAAVRIHNMGKTLIEVDNRSFYEMSILQTDPSFFHVFDITFLRGNPANALSNPNDIVLTEETSKKYFGNQNAMGKTIVFDEAAEYRVSGIIENVPEQTHLDYSILVNIPKEIYGVEVNSWNRLSAFFTYLLVEPNTSPKHLANQIPRAFENKLSKNQLAETQFGLQPFNSIHLHSNLRGELVPERIFDIRYLYLFSSVGVLILIIAGINYVNLATARATDRLKEIGIRKSSGAHRIQLFWQFVNESVFIALGSALTGILLAEYGISFLNSLMQQDLGAVNIWSPSFIATYWVTAIFIGFCAGIYPAWFLSSFNPTQILKGNGPRMLTGEPLRKSLVVFQFTVTLALIISTIVIYRQLDYFQNKKLGLDPEQVMNIELESTGAKELGNEYAQKLRQRADIEEIAAASALPGKGGLTLYLYPDGRNEEPMPIRYTRTDNNYLEVLGITLLAGRNFNPSDIDRKETATIINETAAREMGWDPEEAIGKNLGRFHVIGVVQDYHTGSLKKKISPNMLVPIGDGNPSYLVLKVSTDKIGEIINHVKSEWNQIAPTYPFLYSFLDDTFDSFYRSELHLGYIFTAFSLVAVVIAGMGLFGLVSFMCNKRSKEIGIRKVLGATAADIIALLSRDYIKLVGLGFIIASPIAAYGMNRWLQDFAYRIELDTYIFLIAGAAAVAIALLTVSWQSMKTALINPADTLKNE